MSQLNTVFAHAQQITLRAIRTLANSHCEDWSSLSPAAISLLMPVTPWQAAPERQPSHADTRT